MKILLIVFASFVVLIALVAIVGALLPRSHLATRQVKFRVPASQIYAVARDFATHPSWRSGLKSVELMPSQDGRVCYRENSRHGPIAYVVLEDKPGEKLVVKIADEKLPFGGTWTFEFSDGTGGGGNVRITERGEVKNVIFRALARFVFGYNSTIEGYLRDLGKKFGETAEPQA